MTFTFNGPAPHPLIRVLAAIVGLGVPLALVFFGAVIAAVAGAVAIGAGLIFWLRSKLFRRPDAARDANVIEGEFEVVNTRAVTDERAP